MANDRSAEVMRRLFQQGKAMQGPDGPRFPIANADDLSNAIRAVGRVKPADDATRNKVRRFIISRASALKLSDQIPANWNADGSLKP